MEQDHLPIALPVLEKMHLAAHDNVLDVGCGSGWLSRRISKLVPEGRMVGMDISDEMIRVARRTSLDQDNILFITGEVGEIPWEPNFFSHAISVESAYYWPDPRAGIRELHRVLRPGGAAWILINYYRDNPFCHQWSALLAVPTHLWCRRRGHRRSTRGQGVRPGGAGAGAAGGGELSAVRVPAADDPADGQVQPRADRHPVAGHGRRGGARRVAGHSRLDHTGHVPRVLGLPGPDERPGAHAHDDGHHRPGGAGQRIRVFDIIDSRPAITDKPHAVELPPDAAGLSFDDVRFGYAPSQPVLRGLSLRVEPGETVAGSARPARASPP